MIRVVLITINVLMTPIVQAADPKIIEAFFGQGGIDNKVAVYHGEMLELRTEYPTLGEGLPAGVKYSIRLLNENITNASYAVLLSNGKYTQDWYAFLVKDKGIWKLSAVRKLAQLESIYQVIQQLENNPDRTPEEEWQLQNMKLTLKTDRELKLYLKSNIEEFKKIVAIGMIKSKSSIKNLYLNFVSESNGIFDFNIGGVIDNSVGFLFVTSGKRVPKMSPDKYIYIEKIVDGWYVYKTT